MEVKGCIFSSICEPKIFIFIENTDSNNIWLGNDHIDIDVDDFANFKIDLPTLEVKLESLHVSKRKTTENQSLAKYTRS